MSLINNTLFTLLVHIVVTGIALRILLYALVYKNIFSYLQMIIEANAHAHQLLIYDARPAVNAKVNKVSFWFV